VGDAGLAPPDVLRQPARTGKAHSIMGSSNLNGESVMRICRGVAALVGLLLRLMAPQVGVVDISVFSSTALRAVLNELGPQFEKATGNKLVLTIGPAAVMTSQINQGATF